MFPDASQSVIYLTEQGGDKLLRGHAALLMLVICTSSVQEPHDFSKQVSN
jgi:hypothetical protein